MHIAFENHLKSKQPWPILNRYALNITFLQNLMQHDKLLFRVVLINKSIILCLTLQTTQTQHLFKRPSTTCAPQEVPMQSCIWQHLRASFFHSDFNLICCQGIEEAVNSIERYIVDSGQRDWQMNTRSELWSIIITSCKMENFCFSFMFIISQQK